MGRLPWGDAERGLQDLVKSGSDNERRARRRVRRRRLLGEGLDAAEAAFRVGFESPYQFSHELWPMFGAPPRQDVAALQIEVQPATSSGFHLLVSVR